MHPSSIVASLVLVAAGCGAATPPAQDITQADSSVRAAEEVGAAKIPAAALHLKMAKDQIAVAQKLIAGDEMVLAQEALRRASLDAELAVALSREDETRREAIDVGQQAAALRTGAP